MQSKFKYKFKFSLKLDINLNLKKQKTRPCVIRSQNCFIQAIICPGNISGYKESLEY